MTRYSPWDHLEAMPHITFGITRLPHGQAWWLPDLQSIALDDRLSRVERKWRLAHELVHAEEQDGNCHYEGADGPRQARRQEVRADRIAARRLISFDDLYEGLRQYPFDPDLVAEFLDVPTVALKVRLQHLRASDKETIRQRLVEVGAIIDDRSP